MTHRRVLPVPGRSALATLLAVAGLALLAPPALQAQEGEEGDRQRQQLTDEREAIQRLQEIQRELAPLQRQAFQDTAIRRMANSLDEALRAAMAEADPETQRRFDRLSSIPQEARQARAESDTARVQRLIAESQRLQQRLQQTRNRVLEEEGELQERVETFRSELKEAMIEMDPGAEELLRQRDSLLAIVRQEGGRLDEEGGGGR